MILRFPKTLSLVFLLLSIIASTVSAAAKLEIHDAWVREAPPNAEAMAAYLTLHNHSSKTYTLVSVSSPDFVQAMMHRTEQQDGMTTMLPISRVIISPNGSVSFQPGGMHLMLMKPKKHLVAGDKISLTLFFSDESSMKINLSVKKDATEDDHAMDHMEHMQHSDHHHTDSQ